MRHYITERSLETRQIAKTDLALPQRLLPSLAIDAQRQNVSGVNRKSVGHLAHAFHLIPPHVVPKTDTLVLLWLPGRTLVVYPLLIERKLAVEDWWGLGLFGRDGEAIGFEDEASHILDLLEVLIIDNRLLISIVVL